MKQDFVESIKNIKNKKCWAIIGPSIGSIISLDFGEMIKFDKPITNKNLSELEREYKGEYSILVTCDWILELDDNILCTSDDKEDKMVAGLMKIKNQKVKELFIQEQTYALRILFDNRLCLYIFVNDDEFDYNFYCPEGGYGVEKDGLISYEPNIE